MGSIYEELPEVGTVLGLLELIKDRGGKEDIYKLSGELQMDLAEMLKVIRGAELLGLVHTPGGDVVLEVTGAKMLDGDINERKRQFNLQLRKIPIFKSVWEFLHERPEFQATRDETLEKLAELLPNEDAEMSFANLLNWGRYAELFGYNDDTHTFYIDTGAEVAAQ